MDNNLPNNDLINNNDFNDLLTAFGIDYNGTNFNNNETYWFARRILNNRVRQDTRQPTPQPNTKNSQ